jgi:hypothetical protein
MRVMSHQIVLTQGPDPMLAPADPTVASMTTMTAALQWFLKALVARSAALFKERGLSQQTHPHPTTERAWPHPSTAPKVRTAGHLPPGQHHLVYGRPDGVIGH